MYEKFYNFNENAFGMTPDPKFFFPSEKHTDALDSLIYTIAERRGFAVITGEIGSGKTTICRTLLNRLGSGTKVAMVTNTYLTSKELLSYILDDLGVACDGGTKSRLLSRLKKFLIEQLYLDFNVALIIDEAQNLNPKILEEIRMLSNLETEKKKMLQIILTGQPELKDKLELKELTQLRQRINVQYHVSSLDRIDTERYINHRLRVASINGKSNVEFTPEAIDEIFAYSHGIPREINMICNSALLIGYVMETKRITPQIIKEAAEEKLQKETKIDKTTVSLYKHPIIKLSANHQGADQEVLTASTHNGKIEIDPIDNGDLLNSFYRGIRVFHRIRDFGNYKNLIFSAKRDEKRDYPVLFKLELSNGAVRVDKYQKARITDSWQRFNIPLEDFSGRINLNTVTESALFPNDLINTDSVTYVRGIYFSNDGF